MPNPTAGIIATIVSVIMLLFGASGVFGQLQASLNRIWEVKPKPGRGVLGILRDRLLSFGFTLVVGFLLLVSLVLTAAIALVADWMGGLMPGSETLAHLLNLILCWR
jgi:membrane protein